MYLDEKKRKVYERIIESCRTHVSESMVTGRLMWIQKKREVGSKCKIMKENKTAEYF